MSGTQQQILAVLFQKMYLCLVLQEQIWLFGPKLLKKGRRPTLPLPPLVTCLKCKCNFIKLDIMLLKESKNSFTPIFFYSLFFHYFFNIPEMRDVAAIPEVYKRNYFVMLSSLDLLTLNIFHTLLQCFCCNCEHYQLVCIEIYRCIYW